MIHQFAVIENGELVSVITVFGGMLAGFFAIAQVMLKQSSKDREADRKERQEFSKAIARMADNSGKVAVEAKLSRKVQEKGFEEAKTRNGHLGQQNIQIAELVKSSKKDMLEAVQNIKEQHVEHQTVDETVVQHKK